MITRANPIIMDIPQLSCDFVHTPDLWSWRGHSSSHADRYPAALGHLTEDERAAVAAYTGDLLLAKAAAPVCSGTGDLLIQVHAAAGPGTHRIITIEQAHPKIALSWRLLCELTRRDSVLPWLTLHRACSCPPGKVCWHFERGQLCVQAAGRPLIYLLADGSIAGSDAIIGWWPDW